MMSVSNYQALNQLNSFNNLVKLAENAAVQSLENPVKLSFPSESFLKKVGKRKHLVLPKPVTKRVKVSDLDDKEIIKHKISHLIRIIADQAKDPKEKVGGNWQCWSKEEEIFLVGAVLDRFFARGSLSSTKQENSDSTKKNCWDTIKETYDKCFKKYCAQVGNPIPPSRTENALSRHYKVMKERSLSKTHKNSVDFRALYEQWETNFNQKYQLIVDPIFDTPSTKKKELMKDNKLTPLPSKGRWNYSDEVVLIGIVVETFFNRGSLSSSHKERKKKEKDLWQNLHELYREIKKKYNENNNIGSAPTQRTAQALARHFKVLKVKLIESKGKINLKTFYREWVKEYRQIYLGLVAKKQVETPTVQSFASMPQQNMFFSQSGNSHTISEEAKLLANLRSMQKVPFLTKPRLTPTSYPLQTSLPMNSAMNGFPNINTHPFGLNSATQMQRPDYGFTLSTPAFDMGKINDLNFPTRTSTPSPKETQPFNTFPTVVNPTTTASSLVGNPTTATPLVTTAGNATTYWLPLTLYNVENLKQCN